MEKAFYLAQLFGGLNTVFTIFGVIFGVALIVTLVGRIISSNYEDYSCNFTEKEHIIWKRSNKITTLLGIIFITLAIILPSKRTYLLMMSGKIVDMTIEQNPEVKEIPEKTIELLNTWLDQETKKLLKDKNSDRETTTGK